MNKYINLIADKLTQNKEKLKLEYSLSKDKVGTRFFSQDDLLPNDLAMEIFSKFDENNASWRKMDSFREKKVTSKNFKMFSPILEEITFAIQSPEVLKIVSEITNIKNIQGDESLYAGGLSLMKKDDFLGPHIDNSHNQDRTLYRRLNALYYVSPNWTLEHGGNLELWDKDVLRNETIISKFNRFVMMETNHLSWHSVSKVKEMNNRCCVSNYYFSPESPNGKEYFHVTSFQARPEQKILRAVFTADNLLRNLARKLKPDGMGKKDLYNKY